MNLIVKKTIAFFAIMMIVTTTAHSSEFISHAVLTLPDDPRIEDPWDRVINTQEEWESFFYSTTAHMTFLQSEAPIAPQINFDVYQIIAGGLGMKPSGGNVLSVQSVQELDDKIAVNVIIVKPGSTCSTIQTISYPSATVLIYKTDKPMEFTVLQTISECP